MEEEVGSEQVRALAAALAPQVRELESLMDDPLLRSSQSEVDAKEVVKVVTPGVDDTLMVQNDEVSSHGGSNALASDSNHEDNEDDFSLNLDDDDMDQELEQLAFAEDILRRELDLAKDFASFFGSSAMVPTEAEPAMTFLTLTCNLSTTASQAAALTPANLFQSNSTEGEPAPIPTVSIPTLLVQQDEADLDGDEGQELQEEEDGKDHVQSKIHPHLDGTFNPRDTIKKTFHFGTISDPTERNNAPPATERTEVETPNRSAARAELCSQPISPKKENPDIIATNTMNVKNAATSSPSDNPPKGKAAGLVTPKIAKEEGRDKAFKRDHRNNNYHYKYKTPTPNSRRKTSFSKPAAPETPQTSVVLFKEPTYAYTSTEHFQLLRLRKEPQGAWYSVDLTSHVVNTIANTPTPADNEAAIYQKDFMSMSAGMGIKEYCLSITQWKRLFVGLRLEVDEERQQQRKLQKQQQLAQQQTLTPNSPNKTVELVDPSAEKAPVRTISIRIRPDILCGAVMDAVTQTLVNCPHSSIIKRQGGHLQATVRGIVPPQTQEHHHHRRNSATPASASSTPAPSTTASPRSHQRNSSTTPHKCTFFVDVQLCTHKSAQCERLLLLRVFHWGSENGVVGDQDDMWSPSSTPAAALNVTPSKETSTTFPNNDTTSPPLTLQAQDALLAMDRDFGDSMLVPGKNQHHKANLHLREASALIQRIESPEVARKIRPLILKSASTSDVSNLQELVSDHLLHNYRACPSVLQPDTTITLPALSPQDWPVIQAAWDWIHLVWDELETRELTYLSFLPLSWTTVITTNPSPDDARTLASEMIVSAPPVPRFGAFPALPTLDVQYCSQLRRLSREAMIGQLLKAASVLEDYARQAEYQCANLIDLLRPTFAYYQVQTPSLPKPAPLASYPLEYTHPQSLCPPWGIKVMEALNQVAAMSHVAGDSVTAPTIPGTSVTAPTIPGTSETAKNVMTRSLDSIALAETSVQMVNEAFQQQDDEEHSARLARKNLQVMDRLTKMQEHNRASIRALGTATTDAAMAAADDFFLKAKNAIIGLDANRAAADRNADCWRNPWREVPLLKWTLGVGGSSGTCTITPNQLLFTPAKLIPLLGQSQSTWFFLGDIEFDIIQTQATLLNPLTTTLNVLERRSGMEAYNFKPSSAGQRLKSFLDIVQKEACANEGEKNTEIS